MNNIIFKIFGAFILSAIVMVSCNPGHKTVAYTGKPYRDSVYAGEPQKIPGKLQCEYYDFGGEGIAFHDSDSSNSGSGALNPDNGTYLNGFRINEAVDISYTKFFDPAIDNTPFNFVNPEKEQLYVGWTNSGEWLKYTIMVEREGLYQLGLMYTAHKDGKIAFSINNIKVTDALIVPSTFVAVDTVAWRQWHHWNYSDSLTSIKLKAGIQTLTLHTVEVGDMNYEHIDFKWIH